MPFDFHNQDRIGHLIEELTELRYRELQDIPGFLWYEDDGTIGNADPMGIPEEVHIGYRWKGYDRYNWLCTSIRIPDELKNQEVIGLFDFGVPAGTGNNSHFESLLYLNGKPYQGVDGNHKEVFLDIPVNGQELELKFRVWSGLNGGGKPKEMVMELERAQIGVLDHPTDDLYFLSRSVLETYGLLEKGNEYREWLLNVLVKTFQLVDYTEPGSKEFYQSTGKAYAYLNGQMDGRGKPGVKVSMLGHTHIDVAWLWRIRHTREKAARSFSTVNRMMERYGHYSFLQSQAQLYDYIKQDYPEVYARIKRRVAEGKWEPSGSMWVECDCNLASGESIVRQILMGKNFFQKEFGYQNDFLWLPDVFGYSWALPQILKKSGIDTFITTKISWNDTNRLPYDTFTWRGIDGTEILAHFITTTDLDSDSYTYNGDTRPYAVKGVWDNYKNKDLNRDLLISYGYGDGGGGPNRDMLETMKHLNKIPGLPYVQSETGAEYFKRLHNNIRENALEGYLPVWDGELYLEFHRGTYTSQAYNKKMNRRMEYMLYHTELLSVLAAETAGVPYNEEAISEAVKIILCQQFHDILPGSAIKEVYEDSHTEYEKAQALLNGVLEKAYAALCTNEENTYTLWNNQNWKRSTYVELSSCLEADAFTDDQGNYLPCTMKDGKAVILVKDMEPFSFINIRRVTKPASTEINKKENSITKGNTAATKYYEVSWNEQGQLTRLFDKEADREILTSGKYGNVLQIFEDKPRCFDAWELEPTLKDKLELVEDCMDIETEENAIGIFLRFKWRYHKSVICQTMCLYHEKRRIDFKTEVEWQERQKLMKVAFPVNIRAVDARFDIQFGNIRRPITRNNSWEAAKFEVAAHKWADISEAGYGVALLNDCKYGYDILEDTLRLTLIKSAVDPDYTADLGHHEFTYSLYPHREEWYRSGLEEEAFDLNVPIIPIKGRSRAGESSLLTFDKKNVVIDCIKKAENSSWYVIRLHEFTGGRSKVTMTGSLTVKNWCECNLMEEPVGEVSENEVVLDVKPNEIKSILVQFNGGF